MMIEPAAHRSSPADVAVAIAMLAIILYAGGRPPATARPFLILILKFYYHSTNNVNARRRNRTQSACRSPEVRRAAAAAEVALLNKPLKPAPPRAQLSRCLALRAAAE
jgi:hypothetical protein